MGRVDPPPVASKKVREGSTPPETGAGGTRPSLCRIEQRWGGSNPPRVPATLRQTRKKKIKNGERSFAPAFFCCPPSCLLFVYVLPSSSFVGRAVWMDGGGRGRGRGSGGGGGWKRNALMSWQIVVPFSVALLTLSYGYHFEKNAPAPAPVPN